MRRVLICDKKPTGKGHCPSIVFTVLVLAASIAIPSSFVHPMEALLIGGAGSDIGSMRLMAEAFKKKRPDIAVTVLPSLGTAGGIRAVYENKVDIGLTSRPLKPEERALGLMEETYGRSAVVFGVQESNPVKELTLAEIEDIYSGKRKTWPGGMPMRLTLRPKSDRLSEYMAAMTPSLKSASEKAHSIPGVFVAMTDQDAASHIERTPGSFGLVVAALVSAEKRRIKTLSVDGVAPTAANVLTGAYPYAVTLSFVYKRNKYKGAVKDFIELVFSPEGRELLRENAHVALPRTAGE